MQSWGNQGFKEFFILSYSVQDESTITMKRGQIVDSMGGGRQQCSSDKEKREETHRNSKVFQARIFDSRFYELIGLCNA